MKSTSLERNSSRAEENVVIGELSLDKDVGTNYNTMHMVYKQNNYSKPMSYSNNTSKLKMQTLTVGEGSGLHENLTATGDFSSYGTAKILP